MPEESLTLYQKYRPRRFGDMIGQQYTDGLRNAVATSSIKHAYGFFGPRGCGKTTSARVFAAAINCEAPEDGEPCGKCYQCEATFSGANTGTVMEVNAADVRGIDGIRELLTGLYIGGSARKKIYILDEVHQLTKEAQSLLLKPIEEPPSNVVFLLCTTHPEKLEPTIRSRIVKVPFSLVGPDDMRGLLQSVAESEKLDVSGDDIEQAVRNGGGSPRDSLSALEAVLLGTTFDPGVARSVVAAVASADLGAALAGIARGQADGAVDFRLITEELIGFYRNVLVYSTDESLLPDATPEVKDSAAHTSARKSTNNLEMLVQCLGSLNGSNIDRIVFEGYLVKLLTPTARAKLDQLMEEVADLTAAVKKIMPDEWPPATGAPAPAATAGSPEEVQRDRDADSDDSRLAETSEPEREPEPEPERNEPATGATSKDVDEFLENLLDGDSLKASDRTWISNIFRKDISITIETDEQGEYVHFGTTRKCSESLDEVLTERFGGIGFDN